MEWMVLFKMDTIEQVDDGIDGPAQNGYNEQVNDGIDGPAQNEYNKLKMYKPITLHNCSRLQILRTE